jgi:hypothetical protein
LAGHHRPLCSECVLCVSDPWDRVGVGIDTQYRDFLQHLVT